MLPSAIEIANQRCEAGPYADRLEFYTANAIDPNTEFPSVDLVTALGVLEYFDEQELRVFMENLETRYFFFDFLDISRKHDRLKWWLRQVYLKINRCPGVYL
ncbi:MAG: class I SAM-dependent methyltransferase [Anaerolineales bacterium]|nr:class I SAM-dependent methyltransferase [Anaerolineales bacterium]